MIEESGASAGSEETPGPRGTSQKGITGRGGMIRQAGRDLYDIDVHPTILSPAAAKAARAKPLVMPRAIPR
jgi:hypothetical protein